MKKWFLGLAVVAVIVMVMYPLLQQTTETAAAAGGGNWLAELQSHREEQQDFYKGKSSPLTERQRGGFALKFFEPNPDFRIKARYYPEPMKETVTIATTTGKQEKMLRHGKVRFTYMGEVQELTLLQQQSTQLQAMNPPLFLGFTDFTNGVSTYGGGRYLEVALPQNDSIIIDFNRAYQPYCAYNETYSCPVPLRANRLFFEVEAGERL
jgi:uncharacterized protein (DUF1684 family)